MLSLTWETRIPTDMCFPTWETHIPSDVCSPAWETLIPTDMCSSTWETDTSSHMCSPTWETHIPSDICSPTLETHIPSGMCYPTWETHIPNDICSPTWETGGTIWTMASIPLALSLHQNSGLLGRELKRSSWLWRILSETNPAFRIDYSFKSDRFYESRYYYILRQKKPLAAIRDWHECSIDQPILLNSCWRMVQLERMSAQTWVLTRRFVYLSSFVVS